jgi:glycosyltransferase involved in cell wall biosynthesis
MKPQVTVLVTVYNRTKYVAAALQSIIGQSFEGWRAIVVDDGSTEPSIGRIVKATGDPRVEYVKNANNQGVARVVREGIARIDSEYFAVLNDDDTWESCFLSRAVGTLEAHRDAALAFCDHWLIDENGRPLQVETDENSRQWGRVGLECGVHEPWDLVARKSIPLVATVFRRSAAAWQEIPDEVGPYYDYWLTIVGAQSGRQFCYVPERMGNFRIHAEQATVDLTIRRADEALARGLWIDRRLIRMEVPDIPRSVVAARLRRTKLAIAKRAIVRGDFKAFLQCLVE